MTLLGHPEDYGGHKKVVDFAKVVKQLSINKIYWPDKITGESVMRGNLPDEC